MALIQFSQNSLIEAGCDEAGRGCLAGPVYAAAVILNPKKRIKGLDDSKKLTDAMRYKLRPEIEDKALAFAIAALDNVEIDKYNILKSSFFAMHKAINLLQIKPQWLLIDGNRFIPYDGIPHQCEIKGDARFQAIAAASILAKTYRDDYMKLIHQEFPAYAWDKNMGYPTKAHRAAIKDFGVSPYHRLTFKLLPSQLQLF
ncbi:MAG: ribonuclease HII [Bacteroidota bacterium]|nr:ribonuclease HII [Bacteroidota bacterium]